MQNRISAELMLAMVLDALPLRIFWKDRESRFLGANQNLANDSGAASPADMVGRTDYDFFPPEQARAFQADDAAVVATGVAKLAIEEPLTTGSGEDRWLETNKIPLRNGHGEVIGVLATYQDITERVRSRQERAQLIEDLTIARDAAIHANAAKSRFLATMSHELRTPLTSIISYAEAIGEVAVEDGREQDQADANTIVAASKHLMALIAEILDFSKLEAGKMVLEHRDFDVRPFIEGIVDTARPLAARNNNAFTVRIGDRLIESLHADEARLRQCLFNLISNAAKFTNEGSITLSVAAEDRDGRSGIRFDVADTGIGMSEEVISRIFLPFSQADETVTRRFGGTGLGLTITKDLIEHMGGAVSVESAPSVGSTFSIWAPASHVANDGEQEPAREAA